MGKKSCGQKILGEKIFWAKTFWAKNSWANDTFGQTIFGQTVHLGKKFWAKNRWANNFGQMTHTHIKLLLTIYMCDQIRKPWFHENSISEIYNGIKNFN